MWLAEDRRWALYGSFSSSKDERSLEKFSIWQEKQNKTRKRKPTSQILQEKKILVWEISETEEHKHQDLQGAIRSLSLVTTLPRVQETVVEVTLGKS